MDTIDEKLTKCNNKDVILTLTNGKEVQGLLYVTSKEEETFYVVGHPYKITQIKNVKCLDAFNK